MTLFPQNLWVQPNLFQNLRSEIPKFASLPHSDYTQVMDPNPGDEGGKSISVS